jgi:hypothetical protein
LDSRRDTRRTLWHVDQGCGRQPKGLALKDTPVFVLLLTTKLDTLWIILGEALVSLSASSLGLIQQFLKRPMSDWGRPAHIPQYLP